MSTEVCLSVYKYQCQVNLLWISDEYPVNLRWLTWRWWAGQEVVSHKWNAKGYQRLLVITKSILLRILQSKFLQHNHNFLIPWQRFIKLSIEISNDRCDFFHNCTFCLEALIPTLCCFTLVDRPSYTRTLLKYFKFEWWLS